MNKYHFFDLLRQFRHRERLSQADLAVIMDVSRPTLSDWENKRIPSRNNVMKLAEALMLSGGETKDLLAAAGHAPNHLRNDFAQEESRRLYQQVLAIVEKPAVSTGDTQWEIAWHDRTRALYDLLFLLSGLDTDMLDRVRCEICTRTSTALIFETDDLTCFPLSFPFQDEPFSRLGFLHP